MKSVDFIIFYEVFNREYQCVYLLKKELESRGYSVVIKQTSVNDYFTSCRYQPKIVVTPWLRELYNIGFFDRFNIRPDYFVDLQWEQMFNRVNTESGLLKIKNEAKKCIHICWGEKSKAQAIEWGVPAENLPVLGGMHIDFCRKEFLSHLKDKEQIAEEFGLDSAKRWSLYVSSFAYASYPASYFDSHKEVDRNFYFCQIDSRKKTLEWISAACEKSPDTVFIYRPHPSEKDSACVIALAEKYSNFKIISKYNIKQWFYVCEVINT